ncbi:MAG: hypothetical protein VKQ33_03040 [Candidatus Sericytochromatia bacterium]|nr:hypothetical protein [Candidatus Sericytochromatia bacterium]
MAPSTSRPLSLRQPARHLAVLVAACALTVGCAATPTRAGGLRVSAPKVAGAPASSRPTGPALELDLGPMPLVRVVPVNDDSGAPTTVRLQPAEATARWSVRAVGGTVRVARVEARYELGLLAARVGAGEGLQPVLPAEAAAPSPLPSVFAEITPVTPPPAVLRAGEPAAYGVPAELEADVPTAIAHQPDRDALKAFLTEHRYATFLNVTLSLLDAAGASLPGVDGQPFRLQANFQVI